MRPYTVIYALTRSVHFGGKVTQHECYHHARYVYAPHDAAAIDLCKDDGLPGFTFQPLLVLEGHATATYIGDRCTVHSRILEAP